MAENRVRTGEMTSLKQKIQINAKLCIAGDIKNMEHFDQVVLTSSQTFRFPNEDRFVTPSIADCNECQIFNRIIKASLINSWFGSDRYPNKYILLYKIALLVTVGSPSEDGNRK